MSFVLWEIPTASMSGHSPTQNGRRLLVLCSLPAPGIIGNLIISPSSATCHRFDHRVCRQAALSSMRDLLRSYRRRCQSRASRGYGLCAPRCQVCLECSWRWESTADDRRCIDWARAFFKASAPYAPAGAYVNFMTEDEGERVTAAYGSNYDRLAQFKKRVDPDNVFHLNYNIKP